MTQTIDDTLAERGSRYGEFNEHASVTQAIKVAMSLGNNWLCLDDDMKEALEMVAHKVGRILNGDPDYVDSWTDIIGYARLVEKRLIAEQAEPTGSIRGGLEGDLEECQCPICQADRTKPSGDWISKVVGANPAKPSNDEVEAALNVLLAAGVVSMVEDGNT